MAAEPLSPGVWGIVATPFSGSTFDVDEGSLARLVEHYQKIGVTGLAVLGVFGEAARLSSTERREVLETVVDTVELPLVVGVTAYATSPAIEEVEQTLEIVGDRLAGAMVQVNSPDPETLTAHLRGVHEATNAPIVVQDYPAISGVSIAPERLASALKDLDFVTAIKAESPPTALAVATLTRELPGVPVFGGLGGVGLVDELAAGAAGAMTGFSVPEALLACVEAYQQSGYAAAASAFAPYLPLVNFEQQPGIALAIRKEALRRRGLILESVVRPPGRSMPNALVQQLARHLERSEPLLAGAI